MTKKISPRLREQAAHICSTAACTPEAAYDLYNIADALGYGGEAVKLAADAWLEVDGQALGLYGPEDPCRDAEAESLLRTGWCPGE